MAVVDPAGGATRQRDSMGGGDGGSHVLGAGTRWALDVCRRAAGGGRVAGWERLRRRLVKATGSQFTSPAVEDGPFVWPARLSQDKPRKGGPLHPFGVAEREAVVRSGRAGQTGLDGGQVEFDLCRENWLVTRVVPEALRLGVGLHQGHPFLGSTGEP